CTHDPRSDRRCQNEDAGSRTLASDFSFAVISTGTHLSPTAQKGPLLWSVQWLQCHVSTRGLLVSPPWLPSDNGRLHASRSCKVRLLRVLQDRKHQGDRSGACCEQQHGHLPLFLGGGRGGGLRSSLSVRGIANQESGSTDLPLRSILWLPQCRAAGRRRW